MEMALITPILLLLVLGVFQVGLAMLTQLELTHAAQQAAALGASEPVVADRCPTALETVPKIYGSVPDDAKCVEPGGILRVTVTDGAPIIGPWGVWNIEAIGRAVAPKEPDGL